MTLFILSDGKRQTYRNNLTSTADTEIVAASTNKPFVTVESVMAACGASPTTLSLFIRKGGTDYYLWNAKALTAATEYQLVNHHVTLTGTDALYCKAGGTNPITVTAVTSESFPTKGGNGGSN